MGGEISVLWLEVSTDCEEGFWRGVENRFCNRPRMRLFALVLLLPVLSALRGSSRRADRPPSQPFYQRPRARGPVEVVFAFPVFSRRRGAVARLLLNPDMYCLPSLSRRPPRGGSRRRASRAGLRARAPAQPTVSGSRAVLRAGSPTRLRSAPGCEMGDLATQCHVRSSPQKRKKNHQSKGGGGHASFIDNGYDCSGTVSFCSNTPASFSGAMTIGSRRLGAGGQGRWIRFNAAPGRHAFAVVGPGCGWIRTDFRRLMRRGSALAQRSPQHAAY